MYILLSVCRGLTGRVWTGGPWPRPSCPPWWARPTPPTLTSTRGTKRYPPTSSPAGTRTFKRWPRRRSDALRNRILLFWHVRPGRYGGRLKRDTLIKSVSAGELVAINSGRCALHPLLFGESFVWWALGGLKFGPPPPPPPIPLGRAIYLTISHTFYTTYRGRQTLFAHKLPQYGEQELKKILNHCLLQNFANNFLLLKRHFSVYQEILKKFFLTLSSWWEDHLWWLRQKQ